MALSNLLNRKIEVAGNWITVEELIEDSYNLCMVDKKIRELKHGRVWIRFDPKTASDDIYYENSKVNKSSI